MNLSFITKYPKNKPELSEKPTHFIEKIWSGLIDANMFGLNIGHYEEYLNAHQSIMGCDFGYNETTINPKIHTMRSDKNNRWKSGVDIHFNIWTGKPYNSPTFRFAPILKCNSVEEIEIKYKNKYLFPIVTIEGNQLTKDEIFKLAKNDGFDSIGDFLKWFNEDWTGKIIHWTTFRYVVN